MASSSDSPPPTFAAPRAQPVVLRCTDAGSGDEPSGAGDVAIAGLTLEGLSQPATEVPSATQAGLLVPAGSSQHFRKAPAYLAAGGGPVTLELLTPPPGQTLAWVPAREWSGRPDLRPWMSSTVTLDGCPDRDATYFGGVLATEPAACLNLRVTRADGAREEMRLRLDGNPC